MLSVIKVIGAALVILFLGISSATAEQNPLQSLFNALGNLGQANANSVNTINESAPVSNGPEGAPDAGIMSLLEIQSPGRFVKLNLCKDMMDGNNKTLRSDLERGDYLAASMTAEAGARVVAKCAVGRYKNRSTLWPMDHDLLSLSLAEWAAMAGQKIVISLQAKKFNGKDIRNTIDNKNASRAKDLLVYAKSNGVSSADAALSVLEETMGKEAKAESTANLIGSAESIVEKFNSNRFGFEQKYLGKTIQVHGSVLMVGGSGEYANVRILGNKKLSRDELGFQHQISCIITSPKYMSKATDLAAGKTVTVRGVFDHDQHYNMMAGAQVNLSGCEILN